MKQGYKRDKDTEKDEIFVKAISDKAELLFKPSWETFAIVDKSKNADSECSKIIENKKLSSEILSKAKKDYIDNGYQWFYRNFNFNEQTIDEQVSSAINSFTALEELTQKLK